MLLRLKETKTILLPTLQHKLYTLQVLSVYSQIYMADGGCGVGHQHPGPAPGVLVLGRGWWQLGPARPPTLPKDAAAGSPPHLASFPPCGSHCHGFPQSTQPNSSFCHMTHCCFDRTHCTSFLHRSVHLGFEERLSVRPPGPMEQDAIVCKSPFNSLSRHLLEQSLNRPMVRSPEQED